MAVKIPERTGEGLAGIDRFSANKSNLADVLNQIADDLAAIKAATQLTDFAAMKSAAASIDLLEKSDDSRI